MTGILVGVIGVLTLAVIGYQRRQRQLEATIRYWQHSSETWAKLYAVNTTLTAPETFTIQTGDVPTLGLWKES